MRILYNFNNKMFSFLTNLYEIVDVYKKKKIKKKGYSISFSIIIYFLRYNSHVFRGSSFSHVHLRVCTNSHTRMRAHTFYRNTKISRAIHVHRINMQSNLPNISIEHFCSYSTHLRFSHPLSVQSSCGTIVKKKRERKKERKRRNRRKKKE